MLRLEDRWVWDWWLADDGSRFHVFYLQAPKALGDQHLRHRNATVGHAVSDRLARLAHPARCPEAGSGRRLG